MKNFIFGIKSSVFIAALLWFVMFSPWTAKFVNFWYMMTVSAVILISLSLCNMREKILPLLKQNIVRSFLIGIAIATVMWCVFYVGDKVSQWMFDFARPQVDTIYGMKGSTSRVYIAAALLLVIGPAEELFWRGYIQERMQSFWGKNAGFIVATLVYTLIHIWSFNFMLIMSALVCGICWGFLYRLDRRLLLPLIISHSVWDACAFVFFPI